MLSQIRFILKQYSPKDAYMLMIALSLGKANIRQIYRRVTIARRH